MSESQWKRIKAVEEALQGSVPAVVELSENVSLNSEDWFAWSQQEIPEDSPFPGIRNEGETITCDACLEPLS